MEKMDFPLKKDFSDASKSEISSHLSRNENNYNFHKY